MAERPEQEHRIIRASELAQYAYCAKAWWLGSVEQVESSNTAELARGTRAHSAHGRTVAASSLLRWAALAFLIVAIIVLLK
jgi:hypothetical protein